MLNLKQLQIFLFALCLCFGTACKSTEEPIKKPVEIIVKKIADSDVALLQTEMLSLQERVLTLERNVEAIQRFERSGIKQDNRPLEKMKNKEYTPLAANIIEKPNSQSTKLDDISAKIAEAELKIQEQKYQESLESLQIIFKNFPTRVDAAHTSILITLCQVELKNFEAALETIRGFYLRFPSSDEFLQEKLYEASIYRQQGAKEKAIRVYLEVISLSPTSNYASKARVDLQRLRDEK